MLSIDEAIEQEKFKARVDRIKANKRIFHNNDENEISACHRSAEEHEQLAEWLEELKALRHEANECRKAGYKHGHTDGYDKAIDEAKNVILQTLDNEMLIDTLHLRLEQLKEQK